MLVQFENNWIQKIPRTAKLDLAYGLIQFWQTSEFFHPIISKCSPITYTCTNDIKYLLKIFIKCAFQTLVYHFHNIFHVILSVFWVAAMMEMHTCGILMVSYMVA